MFWGLPLSDYTLEKIRDKLYRRILIKKTPEPDGKVGIFRTPGTLLPRTHTFVGRP